MIASANRLKTCVLAVFFAAGSVCAASVPETQVQNEHRLTRDILEKGPDTVRTAAHYH